MKILYHHRTASKDGQAVHIEEMISALRELGHEVIVSAPAGSESQEFGASNGWVNHIRSHLPKLIYELLELAYSVPAYLRLARLAREHRPDVLYERYNLFLLAGIWLRRKYDLPMLLEVNSPLAPERAKYGGLALNRFAHWLEDHVWRHADVVLPVTRVLAGYVERAGVPSSRIEVIPNGINQAHFAVAPGTEEAKNALGLQHEIVLGFTGFVRDWHGLDRVVDWMAKQHKDEPLHLLVVGDGPARAPLEAQARALGISERVTFTGLVPRERIPEMVAAFDIALQPAVTHYASPLKLFEYLALGKAVVAPNEPNLMEILSEGENALLFDNTVVGAFESVLDRLVGDSALREKLGHGARQTIVAKRLTWTENASRVLDRFEGLLRERKRRS